MKTTAVVFIRHGHRQVPRLPPLIYVRSCHIQVISVCIRTVHNAEGSQEIGH